MRSEHEMMSLIVGCAESDDRVRAVVMNGSRTNDNAVKDFFRDFDIVYFVTDVEPYRNNPRFVEQFGEIMIMQLPEDMVDPPPAGDDCYFYLMQFTDGNRLDLGLQHVDLIDRVNADSLSRVLVDKDRLLDDTPDPSDRDYLPAPPTGKQFADCCNEFWWVNPYVAKGLWRDETTYAKHLFETILRAELMKMLTWYFGDRTGYRIAPGKSGKYIRDHVEPSLWAQVLATYPDGVSDNIWRSLFAMGDLFRQLATSVAGRHGFRYHQVEDDNVTRHLRHVRGLPRDAKEMY